MKADTAVNRKLRDDAIIFSRTPNGIKVSYRVVDDPQLRAGLEDFSAACDSVEFDPFRGQSAAFYAIRVYIPKPNK